MSILFSFCHRKVSSAKCCSQHCASHSQTEQPCPAPGLCLPWHMCPDHTLLELCSDPRPCSSQLLHLYREFGLVPALAPSAVTAPCACSSFPAFSLCSLTLQAPSFCWQHPHSFLLAFVSWSSCNQSLLEIHWLWEQSFGYLCQNGARCIFIPEHCADIRKSSCPLASLGAAARLSNIRWSWEEQVSIAE